MLFRSKEAAKPPVADKPKQVATNGSAEQHHQAGRALMAQGKYVEAIVELTAALEAKPDLVLALNARGFCYYWTKDPQKALKDLDEAIRLNPKYLNAYQNRANARKAAGDTAGAAEDQAKIKELQTAK